MGAKVLMCNALCLNEKCNTPEKISRKSLDVFLDNTNFGSSKIKKKYYEKNHHVIYAFGCNDISRGAERIKCGKVLRLIVD